MRALRGCFPHCRLIRWRRQRHREEFTSNDSGVQGDFITNVGAQTISGSLSAPLAQGDKVLISLDGGASWITASASGTNWSASATLHLGSNTLQVKVSDSAGNEGAILPQAYVYDTTAPSVVHVDLPVDGAYGVGQRLDFTVHFSEAVIVDTSGGTPRIGDTRHRWYRPCRVSPAAAPAPWCSAW